MNLMSGLWGWDIKRFQFLYEIREIKKWKMHPFFIHFVLANCISFLEVFFSHGEFIMAYCPVCRFQVRESCSCPQTSVEDQFSSITWDSFSGEVLNSLYTSSPISMHCNQSTAELFPVSTSAYRRPFIQSLLYLHSKKKIYRIFF